ncbi:MAG: LuxR family transcriptional regulator [Betaproteobacteria bacterium]|jgi:LuxR family transcriptional regulator|nr:LuxR family transcriptional regulator [Betaproteobacteria bacterium]NBP45034.1 LuxR family transcriptional regulator [Betaproteobacteria bacterium]
MNTWQEDLLNLLLIPAASPEGIFIHFENCARSLGFDHVAYGFQAPYPVTRPKITLLNNYPRPWQDRYVQAGYLYNDPTIAHGQHCQSPILWSDELFANNPALWAEVKEHGIRFGWAQSSLERNGSKSLLTLCRGNEPLTPSELECKEAYMRWLVQVAHVCLSRAITTQHTQIANPLTAREREVLQWTADGKSAQDIADILTLSKSAVDFHLKNVIVKLQTTNKTAAVARAALLGWLG